ncbi:hypothetical protein AGMMS4952_10240 [Spirochaetia bacterium]|nr:hypothetical protein AGMMS4952_10240 [Spirochaetia bacterium]
MSNYPKTMKALVAYSKTDYRFEGAYPSPECGDDDIVIKVEGCCICAGDLKCRHGAAMFWGDDVRRPYQRGLVNYRGSEGAGYSWFPFESLLLPLCY